MSINNTNYGVGSLNNNTGANNSAFGAYSGYYTSDASCNTSVGSNSLFFNTSGQQNTAIGAGSLCNNSTGSNNTAFGANALEGLYESASVGNENVGVGVKALYNLYEGQSNTSVGFKSGFNVMSNFNNNTFLGAYTDVSINLLNFNNTISNSTALGYNAVVDCSNQIMLGTSSENVCVPGSSTFTGVVNIGSYLHFSDGTTQNSANNGSTGPTGPIGSSQWVSGTSNSIYYNNNGNVGIETSTPASRLDVNGTITTNVPLRLNYSSLPTYADTDIGYNSYTSITEGTALNTGVANVISNITLPKCGVYLVSYVLMADATTTINMSTYFTTNPSGGTILVGSYIISLNSSSSIATNNATFVYSNDSDNKILYLWYLGFAGTTRNNSGISYVRIG
jgi:hypothetical protein